jgi:hypothetical protein
MRRNFALLFAGLTTWTASGAARAEQATPTPAEAIQARIAEARKELGEKAPTMVEGPFVFTAPPGNDAALRSATGFARDVLAALTNGRFRALPKQPVTVMLFFGKAPYEKYCRTVLGEDCISRFGFFRYDRRAIVMNAAPGLGTLSHELVHPLVAEDFTDAPTWINEGIASLYEALAIVKPGQIRGVKNWRHPRLVSALKSKTEQANAQLDHLFGMDDETFRGKNEDLNYALARYVCQWLETQGKLWSFYAKWRDTQASDPTGEKAFTEVMGKTPSELNAAFAKWVLVL